MKVKNHMIENRLKRAVEASVPHVLPELLNKIQEEESLTMQKAIIQEKVSPFPQREARKSSVWLKTLAPIAAALILILGAWFGYINLATQSVIAFDVNPSLDLSVNRSERVLAVHARNEEALAVIGDMKLKGLDLDTAVNALIGSLVRQGYLSELKNVILITVDSKDPQAGIRLQERLSSEITSLLEGFSLQGAILSQVHRPDRQDKDLADSYGISPGKAALIDRLVKEDPSLVYKDLAALPIHELKLLMESRHSQLPGVQSKGEASKKDLIGEDKAKKIAFNHAGIREELLTALEIELDLEDGVLVYEVEFQTDDYKYEYEIGARNGQILDYEFEARKGKDPLRPPVTEPGQSESQTSPSSPSPSQGSADNYIGQDQAVRIALDHAGFSRSQVKRLEVELKTKSGKTPYYEVEFEAGDYEYEYEIQAYSGKILEIEKEVLDRTSVSQPAQSGSYIGQDKALQIALDHAGFSPSQVKELEIEFKAKAGKTPYYEVEFKAGSYEYEYEIEALTGRILEFEREVD